MGGERGREFQPEDIPEMQGQASKIVVGVGVSGADVLIPVRTASLR